jgi:CRP-like cAMP-binding protein
MDICVSVVSYFTGMPSTLIIEAIEPSVCLGIKRKDMEYLFTQIPGLEKIFRGVLSTWYVKKDLEQMNNLRFSKKERFLQFCDEQPELLQRVPQKQLASYLEITPETFCRMKRVRYEMAKEARQTDVKVD